MRSATPRQSKPGPRFEVLAGTRTVTCCIRRRSVATLSFSGNRSVRPCRIESMPVNTADGNEPAWIDASLFRDFQAERTDAHRLCTMEDGWVERFGHDILISFKRVLVRERLIHELK